jgi:TonB family protein
MDTVTQILTLRAQDSAAVPGLARSAGSFNSALGTSLFAHVVLIGFVFFAPPGWFGHVEAEPEPVMTISLSGAPGPRDGGLTPMGGRPIQQAVPVEAKKAIEPVRAPAARAPEMIEPKKAAPKKRETRIENTVKDATSRTPTKGEEVRKGSAIADTGGRGQGFGLSSGGGGTGSYLDTANFCCPEYISTMLDLIRRNWDSKQQAAGTAVVKYTIQRDGAITNVVVEKSSGYPTLDFIANRALLLTRKLPPLPAGYTEASLTVHLVFEYQR